MRITTWLAATLLVGLLLPGCGLITGRYKIIGRNSTADLLLPAPKDMDGRLWTEATLTSLESGEQRLVAIEPPIESDEAQHVAYLEPGLWHIDLAGENLLTGEPVSYSASNVTVTGGSTLLDIESW